MWKSLVAVLAFALAGVVYSAVNPAPALCVYCTPGPCFGSSQCNAGCVCLSKGDFDPGTCVSIE